MQNFFNAVIRDITERKQPEQILAEKEKQLQAILDHSPVAIWLKDLEGRYLKVNRHFEQRVGCDEQEIWEKPMPNFLHANGLSMFKSSINTCFKWARRWNYETIR